MGIYKSVPVTAFEVVVLRVGTSHCTTWICEPAPAEKVTFSVSKMPAAVVAEYKVDR
jgi:hypothetical protein